jgi:hypothetical protein
MRAAFPRFGFCAAPASKRASAARGFRAAPDVERVFAAPFCVAPVCDRILAEVFFDAAGGGFFVPRDAAVRGFDVFARGFVAVRTFVFLVAMISSFESVPVAVTTAGACERRPRGW